VIKDFKYFENDRRVYDEYIKDFLPDRVIDSHIHIWKNCFVSDDIDPIKKKTDPFFSFDCIDEFGFEDFRTVSDTLFPDKEYEGVYFGAPFDEIDIDANNQMIIEESASSGINGLYIPRADHKPGFVEEKINEGSLFGFKPYPDLAIGKKYRHDQDSVCIAEMITEGQLAIADKYKLMVVLHIPKSMRLRDEENISEIAEISRSYPGLKLVLAHAGRSYCMYDIIESIQHIKDLDNVFVDTAMINNWEVIELLLEELGSEKILYGSDFPVAGLRGKNICINDRHYFVTARTFSWSLSGPAIAEKNMTFFIYEEIREIIKAVLKTGSGTKALSNIFYNNIKNILDQVKAGRKEKS
jgi:uncharacterized protein